jgi:hypothetical protein
LMMLELVYADEMRPTRRLRQFVTRGRRYGGGNPANVG